MYKFILIYVTSAILSILSMRKITFLLTQEDYAMYSYIMAQCSLLGLMFFAVYRFSLLAQWQETSSARRLKFAGSLQGGFILSLCLLIVFLGMTKQSIVPLLLMTVALSLYDLVLSALRVNGQMNKVSAAMLLRSLLVFSSVYLYSFYSEDVFVLIYIISLVHIISAITPIAMLRPSIYLPCPSIDIGSILKNYIFVINSLVTILSIYLIKAAYAETQAPDGPVFIFLLDLSFFISATICTLFNMFSFNVLMSTKSEVVELSLSKMWTGGVLTCVFSVPILLPLMVGYMEFGFDIEGNYSLLLLSTLFVFILTFKSYFIDNIFLKKYGVKRLFKVNLALVFMICVIYLIGGEDSFIKSCAIYAAILIFTIFQACLIKIKCGFDSIFIIFLIAISFLVTERLEDVMISNIILVFVACIVFFVAHYKTLVFCFNYKSSK